MPKIPSLSTAQRPFAWPRKMSVMTFALCLSVAVAYSVEANSDRAACSISLSIPMNEDLSFSPLKNSYMATELVARNTNLKLVDRDIDGNITPMLAKSWTVDSENKVVNMFLDPSCRWSDGQFVSAQNMLEGIRLLYRDKSARIEGRNTIQGGVEILNGQADIQSLGVRVVAPDQLEVRYKENIDVLMHVLAQTTFTPSPQHIVAMDPSVWPSDQLPKVGSGAYVLKSQTNDEIYLRRNPYFCSGLGGNIEEVRILKTLPLRAEVGALFSGRVDALVNLPYRSLHDIKERQSASAQSLRFTQTYNDAWLYYLVINQSHEALQHPNVAQAINLLLHHEYLKTDTLFGTDARLLKGLTEGYKDYHPERYQHPMEQYESRVSKARTLMRDAGYHEDNRLKLDIPMGSHHITGIATHALAGMLKTAFFEPIVRPASQNNRYYENYFSGNYDIGFVSWGNLIPDPSSSLNKLLEHRSMPEAIEQALRDKLEQSHSIADRKERFAVLASIENELVKRNTVIPIFSKPRLRVSLKHLDISRARIGVVREMRRLDCDS